MASSANESLAGLPAPENNGAGGSGLLGLPPYWLEGVPGLGAPFISGASNARFGGGLVKSVVEPLVSHERVGDARPVGEYALYAALSGGGIIGAVSMIEGARECEDVTVGWYDLRGVMGLGGLCKLE